MGPKKQKLAYDDAIADLMRFVDEGGDESSGDEDDLDELYGNEGKNITVSLDNIKYPHAT